MKRTKIVVLGSVAASLGALAATDRTAGFQLNNGSESGRISVPLIAEPFGQRGMTFSVKTDRVREATLAYAMFKFPRVFIPIRTDSGLTSFLVLVHNDINQEMVVLSFDRSGSINQNGRHVERTDGFAVVPPTDGDIPAARRFLSSADQTMLDSLIVPFPVFGKPPGTTAKTERDVLLKLLNKAVQERE